MAGHKLHSCKCNSGNLRGNWKSRKAGTGTGTETGTENWEKVVRCPGDTCTDWLSVSIRVVSWSLLDTIPLATPPLGQK